MESIDIVHEISKVVTREHVVNFLVALGILVIGTYLSRKVESTTARLSQLDAQQRILFNKIGRYGILILTVAAALSQIGVDLKVLLGAAGVLTVAVGFAAQTSASNLISGLFLMIERPFIVGDVVTVGAIEGEVMSIDLLSTKIRTYKNLMVRIPNETMVKSNITNQSYFQVKRVDFQLAVSFASDLTHVEKVLRDVAGLNPRCLVDPEPTYILKGFGESAINIEFQVWTMSDSQLAVQNDMYRAIKKAFENQGIQIPYPTRALLGTPWAPPTQENG